MEGVGRERDGVSALGRDAAERGGDRLGVDPGGGEDWLAVDQLRGRGGCRTRRRAALAVVGRGGDPTILDRPVSETMDPPLPAIGIGEPVGLAVERLEASPAILVLDAGHPIGVLTRADVLNFLAQVAP